MNMSDPRVSTAEFIKNFGQLADRALTEPVTITKNGRDRLVVLSVEEYQRLKRRDRQVYRTHELPDEIVAAIAGTEAPAAASAFDHETNDTKGR